MPEQLAMLAALTLVAALWAALTRMLRSGLDRAPAADLALAAETPAAGVPAAANGAPVHDSVLPRAGNRVKRAAVVWPVGSAPPVNQRV